MADAISNRHIEDIFDVALKAGAITGKVSGAGGGGFIMFVIDPVKKIRVVNALSKLEGGKVVPFQFSEGGCHGWRTTNYL